MPVVDREYDEAACRGADLHLSWLGRQPSGSWGDGPPHLPRQEERHALGLAVLEEHEVFERQVRHRAATAIRDHDVHFNQLRRDGRQDWRRRLRGRALGLLGRAVRSGDRDRPGEQGRGRSVQ